MQTTHITLDTSDDTYIVAVNDKIVESSATQERAEQIIESRLANGWRAWRSARDSQGRVLDMLLTISL